MKESKLTKKNTFYWFFLIILYYFFILNLFVFSPTHIQAESDNTTEDYFGLANDNPPEPTTPSYREYELTDLKQKDLTVNFVSGSSLTGNSLNLPHLTKKDLTELTIDNISIDNDHSKLQKSDLTKLDYDATKQELEISLTDAALMKTNGAGTQLILNIKSKDGLRQDQAIIGIWRNYVSHPFFELDIGNKLFLQYMLNNDSTYQVTDSPEKDNKGSNPSMSLVGGKAIPNYRIRDASDLPIIDTMYHGDDIYTWHYHNLFIGNATKAPNRDTPLEPKDHIYVGTNSKYPGRILFQFDSTLKLSNSTNTIRLRVMSCLDPSTSKQQVVTKQKLINYSTDSSNKPTALSGLWLYRMYDTCLDKIDSVPIYFGNIDPITNLPEGIYFKNDNSRYRLDFLFNGDGGPQGWDAIKFNFTSTDMSGFVGKNVPGHTADTIAFNGGDSVITMVWPAAQLGTIDFGKTSPTIGYRATSSAADAPVVSTQEKQLKYVQDPDKNNSLPPLKLNGKVNSTNKDVKKVNLYYLIDQVKIPTDETQRKSLGSVTFKDDQHKIDSWVTFDNLSITDESDLKTLATINGSGHTIRIYGIDDQGEESNLEEIKILPNSKLIIHYVNELGQKIAADNYLIGAQGDNYDLKNSDYLPKQIVTKDAKYKLADETENSNLSGIFDKNISNINIKYQKNGTMAITQIPKLDFGHTIIPFQNLLPISTQTGQLEVTDSSDGTINWKLLMCATPFYLVDPSNSSQVVTTEKLDDLLKYRSTSADLKTITDTPQEVSRYSNLAASASTTSGDTVITNFQKVWWSSSDPTKQIAGPMLQSPNKLEIRNGQYKSTVTWSLENVLN